MILDNTWYYTLSTIAQVFASILWLYSVFVLFKIEKINEFIEELRSILINIIASVETHKNINGNWGKKIVDEQTLVDLDNKKLLERGRQSILSAKKLWMSMSYKSDKLAYRKMENIPLTFENELDRKQVVIDSFLMNLIMMICIVMFSLISLGSSAFVSTSCIKNTILVLDIIFTLIISIVLVMSILKIIKD